MSSDLIRTDDTKNIILPSSSKVMSPPYPSPAAAANKLQAILNTIAARNKYSHSMEYTYPLFLSLGVAFGFFIIRYVVQVYIIPEYVTCNTRGVANTICPRLTPWICSHSHTERGTDTFNVVSTCHRRISWQRTETLTSDSWRLWSPAVYLWWYPHEHHAHVDHWCLI